MSLLSDFSKFKESSSLSHLEKLLVASVHIVRLKLFHRSFFAYSNSKNFNLNVAEAYTITGALSVIKSGNEHTEAVRITILMELQKQLP